MITKPDPIAIEPNDTRYPTRFSELLREKTLPTLYVIGNLDLLDMPSLGFCGARNASDKGLEITKDCATQAATKNICVVSGNAAGVDENAHYYSLEAGGNTILVLPEGIDQFKIRKTLQPVWDWQRTLVISQFPPNARWKAWQAMTRNRLIIAISQALIAIDAGEKSGTLEAGKEALKSKRPLFVARYENSPHHAKGSLMLLEQGAKPLAKSTKTNKPNMAKVFEAIDKANKPPPVPIAVPILKQKSLDFGEKQDIPRATTSYSEVAA